MTLPGVDGFILASEPGTISTKNWLLIPHGHMVRVEARPVPEFLPCKSWSGELSDRMSTRLLATKWVFLVGLSKSVLPSICWGSVAMLQSTRHFLEAENTAKGLELIKSKRSSYERYGMTCFRLARSRAPIRSCTPAIIRSHFVLRVKATCSQSGFQVICQLEMSLQFHRLFTPERHPRWGRVELGALHVNNQQQDWNPNNKSLVVITS